MSWVTAGIYVLVLLAASTLGYSIYLFRRVRRYREVLRQIEAGRDPYEALSSEFPELRGEFMSISGRSRAELAVAALGRSLKSGSIVTDALMERLQHEGRASEPKRSHKPYTDLADLDWGGAAFSAPETLTRRQSGLLTLLVSPAHSPDELAQMLAGDPRAQEVKIAPRMSAKLIGPSFAIVALTPDTQAVAKEQATRWAWEAKPLLDKQGVQKLQLTLSVHVTVQGSDAEHVVRTMRRTVFVRVTAPEIAFGFLGKNWQWFGDLLVALAAWWARRTWFPGAP